MPNALTTTGLVTATRDELVAYWTAQYQAIYGSDIVLTADSPDGQMLGIQVQAVLDLQDFVAQVYASFDPDQAYGVTLDQRAAMNGIQRQGGTSTVTPLTVTVSQSTNLYGLDQTIQPVFTAADNAGNKWQLQASVLGLTAGAHVLNFQAATPGAITTAPNTINVPVTVVLGVTSINNPTTWTTLGINEESDATFRLRRQKSVSLSSQGYLPGILAALENVLGVTAAYVYENVTNGTNSDGVPAHSLWCIVAGSPAAADVASAIYTKRNAGAGLYGAQAYVVTQVDGTPFVVNWDTVTVVNLFVSFTVSSLDGVHSPLTAAIQSGLVSALQPGVNQAVNVNGLATLVQAIDPNALVTAAGFSLATSQVATLSQVPTSGTFTLSYNGATSAAINWNDAVGTVQTKLQAVAGLSAATVTGSLASQTLTITVPSPLALVTAVSSLVGAGGAITIAFAEGYTPTLATPSKRNQFAVSAANIVILPMQLSQTATTATHAGGTVTFTGVGGYGTYGYALTTNNSGATLNTATGAYVAGVVANVVDTVTVKDAFGNSATATVTTL
jgi:hypothetical protein